ncbi:hydroxyacid dehydrogenase [Devosia sp. WQ 349]|uniref:hydroxyacid dehydrogenase n=1 Tax=Devosia sp. WQ 349K1 TaxID=2800329 RepID=UPI0019080E38|nr:hydroxyacid dehydrogenase [Devosia sp. WQ 349K1]MBK1793182.1 hydroxyacid dehydrogenase [Devosia sp. WQ 349K1]
MRPKLAFAYDPARTRHVFTLETLRRLEACCDIINDKPLTTFSSSDALDVLKQAEVLVTAWGTPFLTREVLQQAPNLRLIAHGAGTVKFTIAPYAYERGIRVTHAAEANAVPVAEFSLAAILFANKRVFDLRDYYRDDHSRNTSLALQDQPIGNFMRTVGVIGASRIGRRVIQLLKPFDVTVLLYDPFVPATDPLAQDVELTDLNTLMARSDVVSLHAPALPSTSGMMGREQFALMRDGATFINTARGSLVNEAALLEEVKTGRINAILDVTDPEIPVDDSPFYTLPNVFLTPHIAGAVGTERTRLGIMVADEVERYVLGKPLQYEITQDLLERTA